MADASTGLDTESARAFVNDVTDAYIDGGGGTHWHGCHRAHPRCAALMGARNMALLLAEVERLRGADEVIASWQQIAKDAREAEQRLSDGIRYIVDVPLILPEDDATDVAAYFVKALEALLDDRTETT